MAWVPKHDKGGMMADIREVMKNKHIRTEKLLDNNLDLAKAFTLDFMATENYVIDPDEVLAFMGDGKLSNELYQTYIKQKSEFFLRFWKDTVLFSIAKEEFANFLLSSGLYELGPDYLTSLESHIESKQ